RPSPPTMTPPPPLSATPLRPARSLSCSVRISPPPAAASALSLHDALPICNQRGDLRVDVAGGAHPVQVLPGEHAGRPGQQPVERDRKSTRLNSSHVSISYAVFCLKKKKTPGESSRPHGADLGVPSGHRRPD